MFLGEAESRTLGSIMARSFLTLEPVNLLCLSDYLLGLKGKLDRLWSITQLLAHSSALRKLL